MQNCVTIGSIKNAYALEINYRTQLLDFCISDINICFNVSLKPICLLNVNIFAYIYELYSLSI